MHQLELDPGLTLLEVESPRSAVVHRLTCTHLATADGPAYWIDARNAAATHVLYDRAASRRALDSLRIARAFTAYQHHSLVREVTRRASPETALLVAPNVASLYRDADLADWERADLLAATLEMLSELGRVLECPVLVSSADPDRDGTVADYAETTVECVRTREGIRLERRGEEADAMVEGYWHDAYWQTTIPYWVDLCGAVDAFDPVESRDRGLLEVTA